MLPFEFTVDGPPVSHQTHNVERLRAWRQVVRLAAMRYWPSGQSPLTNSLKLIVTYYHDGVTGNLTIIYINQPNERILNRLYHIIIVDSYSTQIRKTDVNGSFRVRGMSPILADGFCRGNEFLHIRIESAPNHEELI